MKQSFNQFCADVEVKLTDLRKDILSILYQKNKPMGAYEILDKLKKKRPNAEPPTVYRVLDFLVHADLVHKIESQNTYVCCSGVNEKAQHKTVLLFCKNCQNSFEYEDHDVLLSIKKFTKKHAIKVDDTLIEIKGLCRECLAGY